MPKYEKEELFLKSWVFRALRSSIQGAALKTRQLLKKLDQNFYTCDSPFLRFPAHPAGLQAKITIRRNKRNKKFTHTFPEAIDFFRHMGYNIIVSKIL